MTTYIFANNVDTTLAAAASPTDTTLTLSSTANLPTLAAGQVMPLTLNDAATDQIYEIVYVTAIAGSVLTVTRAREGTTAQTWAIGDYAFSTQTAQTTAPVNGSSSSTFSAAAGTDSKSVINASQLQAASVVTASDTGLVNAYTASYVPAISSLVGGMTLALDNILNTNTGASTFNPNGLGAKPIYGVGAALQGGELFAGGAVVLRLKNDLSVWDLISTTRGETPIKAGTKSAHGVNLGQIQAYVPIAAHNYINLVNTTQTISVAFTAPTAGMLYAAGAINVSGTSSATQTATLKINGVTISTDTTISTQSHSGYATISSGQAVTASFTGASDLPFSLQVTLLFIPNPGS